MLICGLKMKKRAFTWLQEILKVQEQLNLYHHVGISANIGLDSDSSLSCMEFPRNTPSYPHCSEKMRWMQTGWKTHKCYASYGVNGSICSFRHYLSVVENHCPPTNTGRSLLTIQKLGTVQQFAEANTDLQRLLNVILGNTDNYKYIRDRLEQHWSSWTAALKETFKKYSKSMSNRKKMNILIHMGLLADRRLDFAEKSKRGGPLGELLQWSDLIACLFLLGHNLFVFSDESKLLGHIDEFHNYPCPPQENQLRLDLIITDIIGLRILQKRRDFVTRHRCRVRLVDSFGTHVEFNNNSYFEAHKKELALNGTVGRNPWGGHGFQLLQHWTFFPHTPDNGFLGFAIHSSDVEPMFKRGSHKLPASLVYGKEKYMWSESAKMIDVLKSLTEVHATVADVNGEKSNTFSNVVNHGFLNSTGVASLLKSVDIFVGLGFPFEGPAPLEAIANGAVFINPKFDPPKSRLNTAFLGDKPTLREFPSQSPYMERLGKPYVYTVDINNATALRDAIKSALKEKPSPFVPEEFTPEGMLIRVSILASRDLCLETSAWPPPTSLQLRLGLAEESCEKACESSGLICEPSFFPLVNSANVLERSRGSAVALILSYSSAVSNTPVDAF
ncbi:hypothetical protein Y032_0005g2574 [Ancylostoma ceylanicum]|uniref:alpha-1,6-mannosyl-glycoprotein 6-beta-N-acetylglucosaminyltransferase n=1 Tax=Ancylostoma ceylanicum TaxID=53326 RepID=A0A016VTD1_9BILA|nr:hypothetical protein Y032_0005g2574 [Ancylostoma ceylanicum]